MARTHSRFAPALSRHEHFALPHSRERGPHWKKREMPVNTGVRGFAPRIRLMARRLQLRRASGRVKEPALLTAPVITLYQDKYAMEGQELMTIYKHTLSACALVIALSAAALPAPELRQEKDASQVGQIQLSSADRKKKERDKPHEIELGAATPVLWQDPGAIERLDLFYGPGGQSGAPNPAGQFTYISDQPTGTQKKIIVKDEQGRAWTVKFGSEARPETAASRIAWAAGYHTHQDYFVKEARITGYTEPVIRDVRFQRRDDGYKTIGNWEWESNPFVESREYNGLKVLMALLDNWDLKTLNNKIERPHAKEEKGELIFFVSDLGATFGRTKSGWHFLPFSGDVPSDRGPGKAAAKGDPKAYAHEKFISQHHDGSLEFHMGRTRVHRLLKDIPVADARWLGEQLARLSSAQLLDAFRAGGYSDGEALSFANTLHARIQLLKDLK